MDYWYTLMGAHDTSVGKHMRPEIWQKGYFFGAVRFTQMNIVRMSKSAKLLIGYTGTFSQTLK